MKNSITETNFTFPGQTAFYRGKVRDVYTLENGLLVMVATDRISAFDVVLPKAIPYKGQVLNQIASLFLDETAAIVPNWKLANPDPVVTIGRLCKPIPVEMIVRAYLSGSAWRSYESGKREICGVRLPDGLKEHQKLPEPIITPTTKAVEGHDEDISREAILRNRLVDEQDYRTMEDYSRRLFNYGTQHAAQQGLILVDTKYEFGKAGNEVLLIDEIHTPDSSRYFYADAYQSNFETGKPQKQLSKEFVREWLMENGFQGRPGEQIPEMTDAFVDQVSQRYIELYARITGRSFIPAHEPDLLKRIEQNMLTYLERLS